MSDKLAEADKAHFLSTGEDAIGKTVAKIDSDWCGVEFISFTDGKVLMIRAESDGCDEVSMYVGGYRGVDNNDLHTLGIIDHAEWQRRREMTEREKLEEERATFERLKAKFS